MFTSERASQSILLRDGRRFGFAEWGDPNGRPVLLFTGAHLVKNGLSPLIVDLIKRNAFSIISGNGATSIHDFELALMGETSEYVPAALEKGQFGMAYEFNFINAALSVGEDRACRR